MQLNTLMFRLLRPLDYLRIEHHSKWKYDYLVPLVFVAVFTIMYFSFPMKLKVFGDSGLIAKVNGLLQVLVGFYIAALAAISTFNNPRMDKELDGEPALLRKNGLNSYERLTRRRFVSLLFGFLSLVSILLYFVGIFGEYIVSNIDCFVYQSFRVYYKFPLLAGYMFLLSQLFVTTLFGLYYLCDKVMEQDTK